MTDSRSSTVAGESTQELLKALLEIRAQSRLEADSHGMCRFDAVLPQHLAAPLWRALMRVEAELLVADADAMTSTKEPRTSDQRCADAFTALAERVRIALQAPPAA